MSARNAKRIAALISALAMALARENYLVVDSSKIGKLQRALFAPMSAFKAIIAEHGETPVGAA